MKSVLISIRPEWCEKIASGEKTVEVRKTRPKIEPPFKCYIYCTVGDGAAGDILPNSGVTCGKVIGEFVCHWVRRESEVALGFVDVVLAKTSCMGYRQIMDYADGGGLYIWNISDLVIYEKPRSLGEIRGLRKTKFGMEPVTLTRPPQSWCYVEGGE